MFDKKKCKMCIYHAKLGNNITCDYAIKSNNGSCIKRKGKYNVDIRGDDPNNCLLFERGGAPKDLRHTVI